MKNNNLDNAKTQIEQRTILFDMMYESAKSKVEFWLSIGKSKTEAINEAGNQSSAGSAIWTRIEKEIV